MNNLKKYFTIVLVLLSVFIMSGCGKSKNKIEEEKPEDKIKVVQSESSKVEYENYDNGLVSLKIPKGWKVDVAPNDYIHYSFKVYNPNDTNYMILFGLKLEGFLKSDKAKKTWKYYYPKSPLASLPVLKKKTTAGFYSIWNETAKAINKETKMNLYPTMKNIKVIQNLGAVKLVGGDVLRLSYTSSNKKKVQALATASVKDVGSYYVTENWNPFSKKVDVWPLNVYNIVVLSAPDEEFNNWQKILDYCLGTMKFSDKFINGFNTQEKAIVNTVKANQQIYNQISDMIMDSWNKRSTSYDIISQKQSDATLGYERVYDTETGDIYKAYNGFTDDYTGDRYKSVTDDMYKNSVSGYIEKK